MAGIKDVARLAGVSTATASRALSGNGPVAEGTRNRVLRAARQLGYVASSDAASLASGRTRNIGLVTPTVQRWFFASVLEGAAHELVSRGYDLTLYDAGQSPEHRTTILTDLLRRRRLDALITVSLKLSAAELVGVEQEGRPMVAVGGRTSPRELMPATFTALQVDSARMARLATDHLLELGHRDIAFLGQVPEDIEFQISTERTRGFLQSLARSGVAPRPEWMVNVDFTLGGAYHQVREMLAGPGPRPTAILCISDEMAFGALLAARTMGLRVPQDISIMGMDGHPDAARLDLSTVDQSPMDQGVRAARLVLDALDADALPARVEHAVHLTQRGSTAAPHADTAPPR